MVVSGGPGHSILVWRDHRSGTSNDLYAQRVDSLGAPEWTLDGAPVCTDPGNQHDPAVVTDGSGGAIVAWSDDRSGNDDIYAQRVGPTGAPLWTANGVVLCSAALGQVSPKIVSDGAGGAIVAWIDGRSGSEDIYAQRVDSAGVPRWTPDGVPVCTAVDGQSALVMISNGTGGAIMGWHDGRSGVYHIYAQSVTGAGQPLWQADGVPLCLAANGQFNPTIAIDGAGGALLGWTDYRVFNGDIYAQRVSSLGAPQWATDGVPVSSASGAQFDPKMVADNVGGAIVTWQDFRAPVTDYDVFAQRVNAAGVPQWTLDGVALCTAVRGKGLAAIASDEAGGAIVTWHDYRGARADIYAQRVNAAGTPQWTPDGVAMCSDSTDQLFPSIVSDGAGGAIVAWSDFRSTVGSDIYALRVPGNGQVPIAGVPPRVIMPFDLSPVAPNPGRGLASAFFVLPGPARVRAEVVDVFGRVVTLLADGQSFEPGRHRLTWNTRDRFDAEAPAGMYFLHVRAGGQVRTRKLVLAR